MRFFGDPEKEFTVEGPECCCLVDALNVVDVCLFTVRFLIEGDLNLFDIIECQHLFFLNDQIIRIDNSILKIPFDIQRMSQLVLNDSI
jgi:hypothetical protein